jgi:hypothetical protein
VLPIPRAETAALDYFVEVVDSVSGLAREPPGAPAQSFAPRVVEKASACGAGLTIAPSVPQATVVVTVARDADGHPVTAALAPSAEARATLAGFRADGVTMASTGSPPGRTARAPSLSLASGGGASNAIVIAGGIAAAGALAALVAAGNKTEASPSDAGSTTPLTGRWFGSADSGGGLTLLLDTGDTICTYSWDVTADLVQSEAILGGSATVLSRRVTCSVESLLTLPPPFAGPATSVPIHGSASGGAVTFQAGTATLTGTYTASLLVASGSLAGVGSGGRATYTWRQTKQ